jgi:hypothetical protein
LIPKKKREFKEAFFGEDFHNFIWKIGFSRKIMPLKRSQNISNRFFKGFGIEDLNEGIIASRAYCIICRNTA